MQEKKYKHLYVYHLQYVVSNGETTILVLVKGHASIGVVQKMKEKNLIKTVGIRFSNFGIDEECIRLNTSSSISLTFEVTNIQCERIHDQCTISTMSYK